MSSQLMWNMYFYNLFHSPLNIVVLISSISLSIGFYLAYRDTKELRRKSKLLYSHIFFLFLPFVFSGIFWVCGMSLVSCPPMLFTLLVPAGLLLISSTAFISLPYFYNSSTEQEIKSHSIQQFVKMQSNKLGIKLSKVYSINEIKPIAYSISNIKSSIFISVGLSEILTKKEMQAVLLHELYHIKNISSFWKFSLLTLKSFSPLSAFSAVKDSLSKEEKNANEFTVKIQGTDKFIVSAKDKMNEFNLKLEN